VNGRGGRAGGRGRKKGGGRKLGERSRRLPGKQAGRGRRHDLDRV